MKSFILNEIAYYKTSIILWNKRRQEKRLMKRQMKALEIAKQQADLLSANNNGIKFVVFLDTSGKYNIFNKEKFHELRRKRRGSFHRTTTWNDVLNDCAYSTK